MNWHCRGKLFVISQTNHHSRHSGDSEKDTRKPVAERGPDPMFLTTNSVLSPPAEASQPPPRECEHCSSANPVSGSNFSVCLFSTLPEFSEARELRSHLTPCKKQALLREQQEAGLGLQLLGFPTPEAQRPKRAQ